MDNKQAIEQPPIQKYISSAFAQFNQKLQRPLISQLYIPSVIL